MGYVLGLRVLSATIPRLTLVPKTVAQTMTIVVEFAELEFLSVIMSIIVSNASIDNTCHNDFINNGIHDRINDDISSTAIETEHSIATKATNLEVAQHQFAL
jgi:hypothetical protein